MSKYFRRHFRIYLRNNHPAYIVDEEGNLYVFHRVTHSRTSGGKKTWEKDNPMKRGGNRKIHIVKHEEKDLKGRFSLFEIELKNGVDVTYPEIKKAGISSIAGGAQAKHDLHQGRALLSTSKYIKAKRDSKNKKNKKTMREGSKIKL